MRIPLTLSLGAVAVLALASCATPDHTTHGAHPAPAASPSASTSAASPSTDHSEHSETPKASSASPSKSEDHGEHTEAAKPDPEDPGGRGRPHKDDSFKVVKLDKGEDYVIQSSTDATKFRLTIESFGCQASFPKASRTEDGSPATFKAKKGERLCVAVVSGKNIGDAPDWAALNYFVTVQDKAGKEYDETTSPKFTTRFLVEGKTPLDESVDPEQTGWMALGYELPASVGEVALRINTAPSSR